MSEKMITKIIAAFVVIAVVIPPLYLGGTLLHLLMIFVAGVGSYEIAKLQKKDIVINSILYFAVVALTYFVSDSLVPSIFGLWAVILFVVELLHGKVDTDSVTIPFILTFIMAMAVRSLNCIYNTIPFGGWKLILYIALACFLCDTGAYFFGVFTGKHKMIPQVSPNKTWEGSIGGFATGCIISMIYGFVVLPQMPTALTIAASVLLPVAAQVGDLSFSSIKRKFGIKDFGNLIPEHGGVLDRVDSLLFCLVVFYGLVQIIGAVL